jgi:hypothetical protein
LTAKRKLDRAASIFYLGRTNPQRSALRGAKMTADGTLDLADRRAAAAAATSAVADTFPKLLLEHALQRGGRPAMR